MVVGATDVVDRAIAGIDAPARAQVGRTIPVRVRLATSEPRGAPVTVVLRGGGRELGRTVVTSPGSGAEAVAEFAITPLQPGLAVWSAAVDSLAGEITAANNTRQVAIEVAPSRTGVLLLSAGLNWDFTFLSRALAGDSSLALDVRARGRDGWTAPGRARMGAPDPALLGGKSVVVLDALEPAGISASFDAALRAFVARGGALIAIGGPPPGVARFRAGAFAGDLAFATDADALVPAASPEPVPEARDLLQWDDDPARGDRAWRAAAPLGDPAPIVAGAGDRVLVRSAGKGPPLVLVRRVGRGQVLVVNGTGTWRWSLSGTDELSGERGRRLWRGLVRALSEPVQGEPLRVRPERWLTPGGEPVRVFATLQDESFRPLAGATVEGEVRDEAGRSRAIPFAPGGAGSYSATIDDLPPGRYRVSARATRDGRELGRAAGEFAVDRFSLEHRARGRRQRHARGRGAGDGRHADERLGCRGGGAPRRVRQPRALAHRVDPAVGIAVAVRARRRAARHRVGVAPETRPALTGGTTVFPAAPGGDPRGGAARALPPGACVRRVRARTPIPPPPGVPCPQASTRAVSRLARRARRPRLGDVHAA